MTIEEKVNQMNNQESKPFNKKSYSVTEAMVILGTSREVIYALIKKGCFQSVRMPSGHRIMKDSFDSWLEQR